MFGGMDSIHGGRNMRKCFTCGFEDREAKPYVLKDPIFGFIRGPSRWVVPDIWLCDVCLKGMELAR
jgi:hypothetical protein